MSRGNITRRAYSQAQLFPDDTRLALATAVAGRTTKALVIDRDNRAAGWMALPRAVVSGRAYAVKTKGSLLAIDLDVDRNQALRENGYGELREALQSADVPIVETASGRDGNRHLFAHVGGSDDHRDALDAWCREHELDVRRGEALIRPPLSPHRSGESLSRLLAPFDPDEALATLNGPTARARLSRILRTLGAVELAPRHTADLRTLCRKGVNRPLSDHVNRLLTQGDTTNRWAGDRSALDHAVVMGMWNAGWTFDQALETLLDPRNAAGQRIRESRQPARTLGYHWRRAAEAPAPVADASELRMRLSESRRLLPVTDLGSRGQARVSDMQVLDAHLHTASRAGHTTFELSERRAAELAGVSRATLVLSRQRLTAQQLLTCVGAGTQSSVWKVEIDALFDRADTHRASPRTIDKVVVLTRPADEDSTVEVRRDLFRRAHGTDVIRGLGPSAELVLAVLDPEEPQSAAAVSRASGLHRTTVGRVLKALSSLPDALAEQDEDGLWVPTTGSLDNAESWSGRAGRATKQSHAHDEQRDAWESLRAAHVLRRQQASAQAREETLASLESLLASGPPPDPYDAPPE